MTAPLTLYICEFSREDSVNESEWFVGLTDLDYDQKRELAYKHLLNTIYEGGEDTIDDVKEWVTIEGVYEVDQGLIKEVYLSQKDN